MVAVKKAVQDICVHPDKKGTSLIIEGDLNVGATLKIVGVNGAGKVTKEVWDGISQRLDQYKTDPRQCGMTITPILVAAMDAPDGSQSKPYPSAAMCPPNSSQISDSISSDNGKAGYSFPKGANICFVRDQATNNGTNGFEMRDK